MNIFALDRDPVTAARWLCDKHISKMIVESGQMLANLFSPEQLATAPLKSHPNRKANLRNANLRNANRSLKKRARQIFKAQIREEVFDA